MVDVGEILVVGVGVNGGHQTVLDAVFAREDLRHWRQAVGGTGGIGDDLMGRAQAFVVDAVDDGGVDVFGWGGNDHLARTGFEVGAGFLDRKSTRLNSSHVKISYA